MKDYKKYKKARKENNLAKTGQVVGGTIAGIGGAAFAGKKILENKAAKVTKGALVKAGEALPEAIQKVEVNAKNLKKVGKVALPIGAALVTGSTVLKKKSDKKLKEYGNENKKK